MNIGTHQFAESRVHALVPSDQRQAREIRRDDADAKVAAPVTRTLVTGVPMALILYFQLERVQGLFDARANPLDTHVHGNVFRNGRTATSR